MTTAAAFNGSYILQIPPEEICTTCRSSRITIAKGILSFFVVNIVAHDLTMTKGPGQKFCPTVWAGATMILSPIVARESYSHTLISVLLVLRDRWSSWVPDVREDCQVDSDRRRKSWLRTALDFIERINFSLWGEGQDDWGLQSAIDCGAVVIREPPNDITLRDDAKRLGWGTVFSVADRYTLKLDGFSLSSQEEKYTYWCVRPGTKCCISPRPGESQLNIVMQSSTTQTIVTIGQLGYSCIELWSSRSNNVRQNGMASPFIVIIPYLVGSFLNFFINLFVMSYPYAVVLQEMTNEEKENMKLSSNPGRSPFEIWLKDKYGLQAHEYIGPNQITRYSIIGAGMGISLYIRAHLGDPLVAASFLGWVLGGWSYIMSSSFWRRVGGPASSRTEGPRPTTLPTGKDADVYSPEITPEVVPDLGLEAQSQSAPASDGVRAQRMLLLEKLVCLGPAALLTFWGVVTAVQELIPFYSDCTTSNEISFASISSYNSREN